MPNRLLFLLGSGSGFLHPNFMDKQRFLHHYLNLQLGILFDQIRPVADSWFCSNNSGETPFWNQAVAFEVLNDAQVKKIETEFAKMERKPAFYLPQQKSLVGFSRELQNYGYEIKTSEVFMFHDGKNVPTLNFDSLKKVSSESELETFMKIFDDCYRSEDEKAGRGSGFNQCLQSTKDDWYRFHKNNRVEFFILYFENKPVGIISLTNYESMGYISNIGVLPAYRGMGLGKQITLFGVEMSKKHGNQVHFLIAEQGAAPEKIYGKIGFESKLVCDLLVKEK